MNESVEAPMTQKINPARLKSRESAMTRFTEHPPVPQVLQEALKDYPELIAELQQSLNRTRLTPGMDREDRTDEF